MLTRKRLLLFMAIIASIMLLTATGIRAHFPNGVPVPLPAPLSCITLPDGNWRIDAIESNGEFPIPVPCSANEHAGKQCAEYSYTVTSLLGKSPDHVVFAVSADQDLDSAGPSANVQPPGPGDTTTGFLENARHEYPVRVNPTPQIPASIVIVGPTSPRISTVLVRKGKISESCLIAGPGVPLDQFAPRTTTQTVSCAAGQCTCVLTFGPDGTITAVTSPDCDTTQTPLTVNGEPLQFFGNQGITIGSGTSTCYPTKPIPTCVP